MSVPDKPDYEHGSTGTKPAQTEDYENGDPLDADNFDFFIHTLFSKVRSIIDFLNTVDSDGDGQVDAADHAETASSAQSYKNNDIDSDGDGKVNSADVADSAKTVKENDIDSDGDGRVDAADHAMTADELDGNTPSDFANSGHDHDGRYVEESGDTMEGDLDLSNGGLVLPVGTDQYVEE